MSLARIDDFKTRLSQVSRSDDGRVWSLALNEIKHLKTASWTSAGLTEAVHGYATSTLRSVLSDYRNAIRSDDRFGPDHPVLEFLRPSMADQRAVREGSLESVIERGARGNRRAVDPESLVDAALQLLEESDTGGGLPRKAVALQLLTGRRTVELFRGQLSRHGNEELDPVIRGARGATLLFAGQAKTRGDEPPRSYEIPVLGDPERVLQAFEQLHREYPAVAELEAKFPDLNERDINKKLDSRVASRMGDYARETFADRHGDALTPKDLRAVYTVIAWEWFAREQSPQPGYNQFAARVLGHNEKDVGTALSYQQFYVVGEPRAFDRAYRRANLRSASLLDADAKAETDDRRRGMIEEGASRFREAAGIVREVAKETPATKPLPVRTEQGTKSVGRERSEQIRLTGEGSAVAIDEAPVAPPLEVVDADSTANAREDTVAVPAVGQPEVEAPGRPRSSSRNVVELVGTVERVGSRPGAPSRLDVAVSSGRSRDTISVSAFREAGEAAKTFEPGDRVAIDGYLAIRSVERDGQRRTIAGVTANTIERAGEGDSDRNSVRVVGNVAQDPRFRETERGAFAALSVATGPGKFADVVAYGEQATWMREALGQGDGVAVDGRVRSQDGRDGFPGTVQIVADDVSIERKKEPRIEVIGRLTRDPQISEGPRAVRVGLSIATDRDGQGPQNVVAFAEKGATWPAELSQGAQVRVVGREDSSSYVKDGEDRRFEFIRADRVERIDREKLVGPADLRRSELSADSSDARAGAAEAVRSADASDDRERPDDVALPISAVASPVLDALPTQERDVPLGQDSIAALTRQIAKTDWSFEFSDDHRAWSAGRAQVSQTLESVEASARANPDGTLELIDRLSAQVGEGQPDVIEALRAAYERGLGLEQQSAAGIDVSELPVFVPGPNEIVDDREAFRLPIDQTIVIVGRSEDGERVFGRDGGGVLSVAKDLFDEAPRVDDAVTISRTDGKDQAQVRRPEVALER